MSEVAPCLPAISLRLSATLFPGIFALRDVDPAGGETLEALLSSLLASPGGGRRIRCPGCRWQPNRNSRWSCEPRCRAVWNTFDTHAKCPRCAKQWTHTACLKCHGWYRHDDWYEGRGGAAC